MTSIKAPTKVLAVASAAAVLSLTACSGGTVVFDFTESVTEPVRSIEFRVPDELVELSEEYAETRVHESITVSSVESEDPSQCAVEYRFEYAEGGLDRLLAYLERTADDGDIEEERMARILIDEDLESIELSEDYSSAVVPVSCAASSSDDENVVAVDFTRVLEERTTRFAWAKIAVMQSGELFVHEPEVNGDWQLDSNGNWIHAE